MRRLAITMILALGVASVAASRGRQAHAATPPTDAAPKPPITIGSKAFTENRILAEIMAQLIEGRTDIPVIRRDNLGGTVVVFTALTSGEIDLYPEYTGTGWSIQLGMREKVVDPLRVYLQVKRAFARRFDLTWLSPFGFSNSYALAMPEARAAALGIVRISDLIRHPATLRVGVSHEFLNREDGYIGLARHYGLQLNDLRGMEHGLAYEAIRSGKIDLIDTWTTDGKLLRYPVRLLEDDRHFFPPYDAAPVVRRATLTRYPQLEPLLRELAYRLPNKKMQALNAAAEEGGGNFAEVAGRFLRAEGLLQGDGRAARPAGEHGDAGAWAFVRSRLGVTWDLTLEHLWLTLIAVLLAIAVAVPLGILLTRRPRWAQPVMSVTGVIQTIPSLALLAFMIPVPGLGLGARSAVAALLLYALLPIVRNTFTGIKEVDADLLEAAVAMGLTGRQILVKIELPLATRTIMAGIRTSTVISIGVATLAAFIGAGGLGDPIVTGLQLNDTRLILAGALPAAGLAIIVDFLLARLERYLAPPGSE